ncbi:MAG: acyltransferase [Thermaerobacter sp.]|nr:acyltransferase [Thermaerobacter sp.]
MTPAKRPYVEALDFVRALTICSVIAVHSTWFTANGATSVAAGAVSTLLHYTRESFMALTGFVLTYSVWQRKVKWMDFWRRRYQLVFFPYVVWSFLYPFVFQPFASVGAFFKTFGWDLLTGQAWFHMYFLLITMQFYLLMPLFMVVVGWAKKHPWRVLGGAGLFEVALMAYDQYGIRGPVHGINAYTTIEVWTYALYLVMGGVAAVHWPTVRAWLSGHRRLVTALAVASAALMLAAYFIQLSVSHQQMWAYSVLQPAMVPWSVLSIALLTVWGIGYEERRRAVPRHWQSIKRIADLSFGIYLFHPMLLNWWMWILGKAHIPSGSFWLDGLTVAMLIPGSALVIALIARTPFSPYVIGRAALAMRQRRPGLAPALGGLQHRESQT